MEQLYSDLKFGVRNLYRKPLISLIVILTIALGIGANTAIFSFVNALLLQPLPYHEPDRLVLIRSLKGGEDGKVSQREFQDMQERLFIFEDLASFRNAAYNISGNDESPQELIATLCSHNLFKVLGVDLQLGTHWPEAYDRQRSFGVVLNHHLWQNRFKSDPDAVGSIIALDAAPKYEVYGVLPTGFNFPFNADIFRSSAISDNGVNNRAVRGSTVLARLKPGITRFEANHELQKFSEELSKDFPDTNLGLSFYASSLEDLYVGEIRPYLFLLSIAVIFLLLIACVNVANLLLSQAINREKEVVIRSIMGSGRKAIFRKFLIESLLLALIGGIAGIILTFFMMSFLQELTIDNLPYWVNITLDLKILLFTLGVTVTFGLLTGVAPALRLSGLDFSQMIKGGKGTTGSKVNTRLRRGFVISQIALGMVLLTGASLITRSFLNLQRVNLGYDVNDLITFRTALPWWTYNEEEQYNQFYRLSLQKIRTLPGVDFAEVNTNLPLTNTKESSHWESQAEITVEGQTIDEQLRNPLVNIQRVTPGYFNAMGIELMAGIGLQGDEASNDDASAVINEAMARQLWPGENPIGKRIKPGKPGDDTNWRIITGVVMDVKHYDISEDDPPGFYMSFYHSPTRNGHFVVKTSRSLAEMMPLINEAIWEVDSKQSTYEISMMEDRVAKKIWENKASSDLFLVFAIIASLLAAIGIYSVMAYAISQRTRELGMRKVLGASSHQIMQLVLRDVLIMCLIGIGIGIVFSLFMVNQLTALIYNIAPYDIFSFTLVPAFLVFIAVLSSLIPTLKAVRINPVVALKYE